MTEKEFEYSELIFCTAEHYIVTHKVPTSAFCNLNWTRKADCCTYSYLMTQDAFFCDCCVFYF